ncbi:hypothetical protein MLPF_2023 [Mycobacterium lepromatosis]|uniref:Uncharacterized protein n=1 Tax=Mycobacterium lepromatosis TaxID=480418 RepID=A0A0F4ER35_9MYCO|nr:hypothetical protein MLPM_1018 [Mycobacterium lepromatosis]UKN42532.1 hypothetical protein MLPF_2023 [Mycobacterium lepromatosis]
MTYDDPLMQAESAYWPTLPVGAQQSLQTRNTRSIAVGQWQLRIWPAFSCRIRPQRHRNEQHPMPATQAVIGNFVMV